MNAIVPRKLKTHAQANGTGDNPLPHTVWVIPWWRQDTDNLATTLPAAYSVHLDGRKAEKFQIQYAPDGYKHFERNASFMPTITLRTGDQPLPGRKNPPLLVDEGYGENTYNLQGVAIFETLAPYMFTKLRFEESLRVGGMILTTQPDDKMRHTALNIRAFLKENGYLPGFEFSDPVIDLQARRPDHDPASPWASRQLSQG